MTLSTDKRLRLRLQTKTSILHGNIHTTWTKTLPAKELVPVRSRLVVKERFNGEGMGRVLE